MSVTISTPAQICNAPYNNSVSKMQYSFSKDKRFKENKENMDRPYYNVKSKLQKRSTTFGYGSKYDFTKDSPKTPPPTSYLMHSSFQESSKKKGFGFGNSRDNMIVTGPLAELVNNKNPGPGSYEIPSTKNRCHYSLRGKRNEEHPDNTPGPGNYEITPTMSKTGSNFFSKYTDHKGLKFTSSTDRFRKTVSEIPGPGNYNCSTIELNGQGKYALSKLQNSKVRKFGTAKRKSLNENSQTPGPGNYRLPSDFGYYANKKDWTGEKLNKRLQSAKPPSTKVQKQ